MVLTGDLIRERMLALHHFGVVVEGDSVMFSKSELVNIGKALVMQEKSVIRLAAKEGQPDSVAVEYRKVASDIAELVKKVGQEVLKLEQVKK